MSFALHVMAAHDLAAAYLTVHHAAALGVRPSPSPAASPATGGAPNPPAQLPPGLQTPVNTILGWGKGLDIAGGVAGLLICGGKMTIGHRNRASFAADGAMGIPWVLAGLTITSVGALIVGVFL